MRGEAHWFWLSLVIAAADQGTKAAIELHTPESFHRVLIPGFAYLVHSQNRGIAFGLLADVESKWLTALLIVGTGSVIAVLSWLLATNRLVGRRCQAGLALILGGAAGNLVDRLLRGSVTDFFEVRVGSFHWPAFNLADSAITVGAALVLLDLLLNRRPAVEKRT